MAPALQGARAGSTGPPRHAAGTFRVELSPDLERRVRERIALIQKGRRVTVVHGNNTIHARCTSCPCAFTATSDSPKDEYHAAHLCFDVLSRPPR